MSAFGGTATVTSSRILYNTSEYGGGVYTSSATASVTGCTITNNSADTSGGGVYAWRNGDRDRVHDHREDAAASTGSTSMWWR